MDWFDIESELGDTPLRSNIPTNCYLRNALSSNKSPMLLGYKETTNFELKRGSDLLRRFIRNQQIRSEDIYTDNWINSSKFFLIFTNHPTWLGIPESIEVWAEKIPDLLSTLNHYGPSYYGLANYPFSNVSFSIDLIARIKIFMNLHRFLLTIRKSVLKSDLYSELTCMGKITGTSSWVMINPAFTGGTNSPTIWYLYPWDSFLALLKILAARLNVLLFREIAGDTIQTLPTERILKQNWTIWDTLISQKGELAVPILKKYEPLCLAYMSVLQPDPLDLEEPFRLATFTNFQDLLEGLRCPDYWELIDEFFSNLPSCNVLYELYGLFRTMAYPHINSRDTLQSIAEHGMKPHSWTVQDYIQDQANSRMEFYRRYLHAYRSPPIVNLSRLSCSSYLYDCLRRGKMPNIHHSRYHMSEWCLIHFEPCVGWEISDSLSSYLSDKATSPVVSDWRVLIRNHQPVPLPERRLLLKFLASDDHSVEAIVNDYEEIYDDEDQKIISIKVKECELKKKGRGFGIMTYRMRLLQVIREALAKRLCKLFPEITITDDEITFRKRRFRSGKRSAHGGNSIRIRTMIDIEKFCSNQRHIESLAVYQSIDELLGTKDLFQRVHPVFSETIIIDGEREIDPDLESLIAQIETLRTRDPERPSVRCFSDGAFIGMEGGIEGLCQYLWTINLIIRVSRVFQSENVSFDIMIQGDNVNVLYDVPWRTNHIFELTDAEINQIKGIERRISLNLAETLKKAGMSMNVEESLTSCTLSIYGKEAYNPNQLSLLTKKISVIPWITSETYVDVPTQLSSLTTSLEAAAEQSNHHDKIHLFGIIHAIISWYWLARTQCWEGWSYPINPIRTTYTIRGLESTSSRTPNQISHDPSENPLVTILDDLITSSIVGSALGGLPFPHVLDLEKRGIGDYISHRLSICRLYLATPNFPLRVLLSRFINLPLNYRVDYTKLFESPYSLNLITEEDASGVLKRMTLQFFETLPIQNTHIQNLRAIAGEGLQNLDAQMSSVDTLHPRIIHIVRELTIVKDAEKLIHKFSSARTLRDLSVKSGQGINVGERLKIRSTDRMCYHLWRKKRQPLKEVWDCSTVLALGLRAASWEKEVLGVTTPSPIEQFVFRSVDSPREMNELLGEVSVQYFRDNDFSVFPLLLQTRGPLTPFIGSTTSGQLFRPFYEVKGDPKAKKAASVLSLIGTLIEFDSDLGQLIRHLGREILQVSTDNPNSFLSLPDVKSDNSLNDGIRKETMAFNGIINILTHLSHKFWNFVDLSGTRLNRSDVLIHGYHNMIKTLRTQTSQALAYFLVLKCDKCGIEDNSQWANCGKVPLIEGLGFRSKLPSVRFFQTLKSDLPATSSFTFSSKSQLSFGLGCRDGRRKHQQKQGDVSKLRTIEGRYLDHLDPVTYSLGYSFGLMVTARDYLTGNEFAVDLPAWSQTKRQLCGNATSNSLAFSQGLGFLIEDDTSVEILTTCRLLTYLPQSVPSSISDIGMAVIDLFTNCLDRIETHGPPFSIWILSPGILDFDQERESIHATYAMLGSCSKLLVPSPIFLIEDTIPDPLSIPEGPQYAAYHDTQSLGSEGKEINYLGNVFLNPLSVKAIRSVKTKEPDLIRAYLSHFFEHICSSPLSEETKSSQWQPEPIDQFPVVGTVSFLRNSCLQNVEFTPPDLLVVIGGGLGGCCVPYLLKYPKCKLLFFTLLGESDRLSEDKGLIYPPALHNHRLIDRLISELPLLLSNGDFDDPIVCGLAVDLVLNFLKSQSSKRVLILNEIETPNLKNYPYSGVFHLLQELRDQISLQVLIKLPTTSIPVANLFCYVFGLRARHPVICTTSYHGVTGGGGYLFLPEWQQDFHRFELRTELYYPQPINVSSLESDPFLAGQVRRSIPKFELYQMMSSVKSQLVRMGVIIRVDSRMLDQLKHELRFGILKQTKWRDKASRWEIRGSSENQRIDITQEEIKNLILAAWLLNWFTTGVCITDADIVEETPVAIIRNRDEGFELLPLLYTHSNVTETFRLSQIHPNRKLRLGMMRLRGLMFILDCPVQHYLIMSPPETTPGIPSRRKLRKHKSHPLKSKSVIDHLMPSLVARP